MRRWGGYIWGGGVGGGFLGTDSVPKMAVLVSAGFFHNGTKWRHVIHLYSLSTHPLKTVQVCPLDGTDRKPSVVCLQPIYSKLGHCGIFRSLYM